MIMLASFPAPSFFPSETYEVLPPYLAFAWSWAVPFAAVYASYYLALEPVAAVSHLPTISLCLSGSSLSIRVLQLLYMPLLSTMFLSASPLAATTWGPKMAAWLMAFSWVAQFAGHGLAEKRAPALVDNVLGGVCTPVSRATRYLDA
jgi:hypothetical protein